MSFDAHGSVQGAPASQPVLEGGVIPSSQPVPEKVAAPEPTPKPTPTPSQAPTEQPSETPPFTPNYKFKVMDKEHEIAEHFRSIIKDPDTEKMVRELHEKAYGLDVVKPRFNDLREKHKTVEQEVKSYKENLGELREHYQRGDFDSFFQKLNIPQEKVFQWVLDKAQYNELPPEQRQVLDAKRSAEQRALALEKEKAQTQSKYEDALVQAKARDLQVALEKDDVRQFSEAFDEKYGNGKFLESVIERGELAWYTSKGKIELTPEQAIHEVLSRYQGLVQPKTAQPAMIPVNGTNQSGQAPAQAPVASKAPTLPNIGGRQSSSVSKSKPKSIDDLKAIYKKMSQGG